MKTIFQLNLTSLIRACILVVILQPLLVLGSVARAGTAEHMIGFYVSLKLIQYTAMSGASDMWAALGSAQKAQECLGLANDLQKGDLANADGMQKFKAQAADLKNAINELNESGAPLTKAQKEAAQKGYLKIAGTVVLWAGAGVTGYNVATANDLNTFEKIAVGVLMAKEVASAAGATKDLLSAWKGYRSINNFASLKEPSKELSQQFASL